MFQIWEHLLHMYFDFFRMIQQAFIDMENMFELLDVGQEVCHKFRIFF